MPQQRNTGIVDITDELLLRVFCAVPHGPKRSELADLADATALDGRGVLARVCKRWRELVASPGSASLWD